MKKVSPIALSLLLATSVPSVSHAIVICVKSSNGAVTLRDRCRRGEAKIANRSSLVGAQGATGASGSNGTNGTNGTDGSIRIFGDGSKGAITFASSATLTEANLQFTDLTINNGVSLIVPAGAVIRCSGTFTNNGSIAVDSYALGAVQGSLQSGQTERSGNIAASGLMSSHAANGEVGNDSLDRQGGNAGAGLEGFGNAQYLLHPGPAGGGGGGGAEGGLGGGTMTVIARGAITNAGTINAIGFAGAAFGGGGGGGGVVILASQTSVTNTAAGLINVKGGNGAASSTDTGAGGGGGAGFIHFISPVNTNSGTTNLTGGSAGSNATSVASTPRSGGGAGGDSYGTGGAGSSVAANPSNASSGNSAGNAGILIQTTGDPTSLF